MLELTVRVVGVNGVSWTRGPIVAFLPTVEAGWSRLRSLVCGPAVIGKDGRVPRQNSSWGGEVGWSLKREPHGGRE